MKDNGVVTAGIDMHRTLTVVKLQWFYKLQKLPAEISKLVATTLMWTIGKRAVFYNDNNEVGDRDSLFTFSDVTSQK